MMLCGGRAPGAAAQGLPADQRSEALLELGVTLADSPNSSPAAWRREAGARGGA